jgi:hypothetical protein
VQALLSQTGVPQFSLAITTPAALASGDLARNMARLFFGAKFPASAGSKLLHFFPYLPAFIPSLSGIPDR